jgi:phytoene dehydrogenase-like protein
MPARVKGPTDHVVVVGAGLAGLSAALRLAGAGRKVTVIERESVPGGRNGLLEKDGFSFDTGPSVLTMPSLIQDAFSCVGEDMKDWLELSPLKPLYRAFYHDGSQIDVHANTAEMEEEIRRTVSAEEALGYRRYVEFVTKLYKYEMNDFIDRNIDSPLNLLTPNLARLIALGGFRRLSPKVNQFLKSIHSKRCMPELVHNKPWQFMQLSLTWIQLTESSSRRVECTRFLAHLPQQRKSMALHLNTAPQLLAWKLKTAALRLSLPIPVSGLHAMRS